MQQFQKPRTIQELLKVPDSQMTPEEKLMRYGVGNSATVRYAKVNRNGVDAIVSREFQPGESIPEGWKESPAEFGVETQPNGRPKSDFDYDAVVAELPPAQAEAKPAKRQAAG